MVGDRACRLRWEECRRVGGDRGKTAEQEKVPKTQKPDLGDPAAAQLSWLESVALF